MPAVCPILSIGQDEFVECLEKDCELFIPPAGLKAEGACSLRALAEGVPSLGKHLGDKLDKLVKV